MGFRRMEEERPEDWEPSETDREVYRVFNTCWQCKTHDIYLAGLCYYCLRDEQLHEERNRGK